jgi:hypothetical protein
MAREMNLHAFREETFAAALTAPGERRAPTLRAHARAKTVLLLSRSLGRLIGAFHKENPGAGRGKSRYSRNGRGFVNAVRDNCIARRGGSWNNDLDG